MFLKNSIAIALILNYSFSFSQENSNLDSIAIIDGSRDSIYLNLNRPGNMVIPAELSKSKLEEQIENRTKILLIHSYYFLYRSGVYCNFEATVFQKSESLYFKIGYIRFFF